jgi:two-component system chemotaxis sensor kinase CheA
MDEFEIDRDLLIETFLAESAEIFARMEQALVALEARPHDEEILRALFRDAHTLKGSAALVAFDVVSELAHDLEAVLERLRNKSTEVTDTLVTLLLRSVDVLRGAISDAAAGRPGASEDVAWFRRRLAEAASGAAPAGSADPVPRGEEREAALPQPAGGRTLRVDVAKLDGMLDLSGEIATSRGRLGEMLERGTASREELLEAHSETDRLYLDLQELIMRARMVPIGPSFHQHLRTVRDVATAQGKQARLVVEGEDVEVDTAVVEYVRDPLTHMVRNAIDHGIEAPEVRRALGKDPVGRILLKAFHETGLMVIQVSDDGAGLPRRKIAERAAAMGIVGDAARVGEDDLLRAVFEPGLSTAERVTEFSGRGVGMDVVRRNVEALRGSVSLHSEEGQGTTVTIRVPLTLAIIQGFRVGAGGETFVLPLDSVVECLDLPRDESTAGDEAGVLNLRGKPLPYLRLRRRLRLPGPPAERENVVVVQHGNQVAGVAVEELHGESSAVIKPLGSLFKGIPGIAGSTILGNGRVALILDVPGLLREALRAARESAAGV